ncbi:hypothetical protein JTB14_028710 [Gonioctena quinquepunctata]|nr:hypothetical protein JTB14_028710 [Gonioctena quinquepunctata]
MADPANTLAAASTSRRKRVLPTQPRSEAKRLRTSSQEDIEIDSLHNSSSSHKIKSGKSGQSQSKKTNKPEPSIHPRSKSQEVPSTSSTSQRDKNSQLSASKSRKHPKADSDQSIGLEFEPKAKRNSRHSIDHNNHKQDNLNVSFGNNNPESSGSLNNTSTDLSKRKKKHKKGSSSGNSSKEIKERHEEDKHTKSNKNNNLNNSKIETSSKEKTERSQKSDRKSNNSSFNLKISYFSNEGNPEAGTSSANSIQVHKYPLRSHSRASVGHSAAPPTGPSGSVHPARKSLPERGKRELLALGASSSQPTTRDAQEPPRLTRSGAVLRRSTRSSKGK